MQLNLTENHKRSEGKTNMAKQVNDENYKSGTDTVSDHKDFIKSTHPRSSVQSALVLINDNTISSLAPPPAPPHSGCRADSTCTRAAPLRSPSTSPSPSLSQSPSLDYNWTYRPLSKLPTPPSSCLRDRYIAPSQAPAGHSQHDALLLPYRYRGPAVHLVNLIPSAASLAATSVPLVHSILTTASLPLEIIALAVCVLDSLTFKFARNWRQSCPLLSKSNQNAASQVLTTTFAATKSQDTSAQRQSQPNSKPRLLVPFQLHIDAVRPELIILAALSIAVKFTQDVSEQPAQFYCEVWGQSHWSCAQFNTTERCILQDLNYRILPLCNDGLLTDALSDMRWAASAYSFNTMAFAEPTPLDCYDDAVHCKEVGYFSFSQKQARRSTALRNDAAETCHVLTSVWAM